MDNFFIVGREVVVLFTLIGVGAVCRLARLVDAAAVSGFVKVLVMVVTPAVVVEVFQRPFDPAMLAQFGLAFAIAVLAHLGQIAIACALVGGDATRRPVHRLAAVFSNAGFMGIPLEYAILGPEGVFYGVVYVAVFNLFIWSWGLVTMRGETRAAGGSRRQMFVNPGTIGLAVGLPLFLLSVTLPPVLREPVKMLADLNTPLAMLVIGYYLAGADLRSVVRSPGAWTAAWLRLIGVPLLLIAALYPFRGALSRPMSLALVTAAAAPVAAMVTMFAAKFDRDVDTAVGLVGGTTLLSVVTLPAVIALAMAVL